MPGRRRSRVASCGSAIRRFVGHPLVYLVQITAALMLPHALYADNFGKVYYDKTKDELVVTMSYSGSNPDHGFSLKWGKCLPDQSGGLPGVTAEVLDNQFQDRALKDYQKITHFSLSGLPCSRPARVTLRTAPRFFYTLTIP
jgi:hypothetical protein